LLIVVGAFLFSRKSELAELFRSRQTWILVGVVGIVAIGALAWFTAPLPPGPGAGSPPGDGRTAALIGAITLENTFDYWTGWIGYFGWLDQPSPTVVYIVWYALIAILLVGGIFLGRGRGRVVAGLFALVSFAIPPVIQAQLYASQGLVWQGRYLLAIDLCMLIAAGIAIDTAVGTATSPIIQRGFRVAVVIMALAQLLSFVQTLRRYVIGSQQIWWIVRDPQWQPPLTWAGVSVLFAISLALCVRFLWNQIGKSPVSRGGDAWTVPDTLPNERVPATR
jgi:hypothetical protein